MVVLDTCALLWFMEGAPLRDAALRIVQSAAANGNLVVPAIVPWEIATLVRKGRFDCPDGLPAWLTRVIATPGLRVEPLTAAMALDAGTLSNEFPGDPADRLIVATARALGVPIVTRDKAILAFASAGHVRAVRC